MPVCTGMPYSWADFCTVQPSGQPADCGVSSVLSGYVIHPVALSSCPNSCASASQSWCAFLNNFSFNKSPPPHFTALLNFFRQSQAVDEPCVEFSIVWVICGQNFRNGLLFLTYCINQSGTLCFYGRLFGFSIRWKQRQRSISHPYTRCDCKIQCIDFVFICCFDLCTASSQLSWKILFQVYF